MASLRWIRSLIFVAIHVILSLSCCLGFVSPVIVTTIAQRQRQYRPNTRIRQAEVINGEVPENTHEKVKAKTTGNKRSASKKKTSVSKAKGTKELKNGTESETKGALKTKKRKKKPMDEGPVYWKNESDHLVLLDRDYLHTPCTNDTHMIQFLVRGNPRPLRRHRTARGFMYNPSANYQATFRQVVREMVWPSLSLETEPTPIYEEDDQLAMRLVFHMKRPKSHFVGGKPGPGRLRAKAPGRLAPTRTDVDNLAKFVLDSLNGLLYVDDRQVASIHATKIYDNDGECQGCIDVTIQRLEEDDVDGLLKSSSSVVLNSPPT